jgi:hypothetical protein
MEPLARASAIALFAEIWSGESSEVIVSAGLCSGVWAIHFYHSTFLPRLTAVRCGGKMGKMGIPQSCGLAI